MVLKARRRQLMALNPEGAAHAIYEEGRAIWLKKRRNHLKSKIEQHPGLSLFFRLYFLFSAPARAVSTVYICLNEKKKHSPEKTPEK